MSGNLSSWSAPGPHSTPGPLRDVALAGAVGGLVAGLPSTVHALATRRGPLAATLAAGTLVLPAESPRVALVAAALPVHAGLSVGWAAALALTLPRTLPRRHAAAAGAAAGLVIAAVDLGVVGRRFPRIRALPLLPQVADHVAYGLAVGLVLGRRRIERRDCGTKGPNGAYLTES